MRERFSANPCRHALPDGRGSDRQLLRFLVAVAGVAVVWLIVLPRLGEVPAVREQIEANEALGINPGAMYYTELEAMPRIIDEVDRTRESASEAFWEPSPVWRDR
ncbi:MAG: hypothetical protein WBC44_01220 [Planctomycetaceae bacterium]